MIDLKDFRKKYDENHEFTRQEIFNLIHEVSYLQHKVKDYKEKEEQSPEWQAMIRKANAWREAEKPQVVGDGADRKWILVLNNYQRDNLLWLFAAIGYASDAKGKSGVEPFTLAMNGDWAGEIPQMLQKPDAKHFCQLDPEDHANGGDMDTLETDVERWRSGLKKRVISLQAEDRIRHVEFGKGTVIGPWPGDQHTPTVTWAVNFDDMPDPFPIVPTLEPGDFRVLPS